MATAVFYLIDKPRFRADPLLLVCALVKKAWVARQPTLVLAADAAQAEVLDQKLWEFDDDSFIPHQIVGEAEDDEVTAVLIVPPGASTPDRPLVINLREDCASGTFDRVLEVVPAEEGARLGSRRRWSEYKARGITPSKHDM